MNNHQSILELLDDLTNRLKHSPDVSVIHETFQKLDLLRRQHSIEEWQEVAGNLVQKHPLTQLFLQDPYTERAHSKPRGYAGDAVMLDYVYDGPTANYKHSNGVSHLGKIAFQETVGSLSGEAVRNRKQILADYVDAIAERVHQPVILAIACGHLREAAISSAFKSGKLGNWYALDQDAESLASLQASFEPESGVIPVHATIRDVIKERVKLPQADFLYSAGLFDYLDQLTASLLLKALFALVKPQGRLLIANFASDSQERGYMESIMDWWLVYRTEDDLIQLAMELPDQQDCKIKVFRDSYDRVIYLDVQRLS